MLEPAASIPCDPLARLIHRVPDLRVDREALATTGNAATAPGSPQSLMPSSKRRVLVQAVGSKLTPIRRATRASSE